MVQRLLDRTFSALADPTRRGILVRLTRGPASISELAEPFGITLTGMKKHVQVLEEARLVTTEKVGRTRHCRLGPESLEDAMQWIQMYRQQWERRLDGLDARRREPDHHGRGDVRGPGRQDPDGRAADRLPDREGPRLLLHRRVERCLRPHRALPRAAEAAVAPTSCGGGDGVTAGAGCAKRVSGWRRAGRPAGRCR